MSPPQAFSVPSFLSDADGRVGTGMISEFPVLNPSMNVQICVFPCPPRLVWPVGTVWFVFISLISGAGAKTPPHFLCSASMPLLDIKG